MKADALRHLLQVKKHYSGWERLKCTDLPRIFYISLRFSFDPNLHPNPPITLSIFVSLLTDRQTEISLTRLLPHMV